MIRRIARPYAKAFAQIVPDATEAKALHAQLVAFDQARKSSSELNDLLNNPGVSLDSKLKVVNAIASRLGIPTLGQRILEVMLRSQKMTQLGAVLDAWRALINEQLGVTVAQVRSAHELTEAERDKLRAALEKKTGKKVELELSTDRSLLAGFVAQLGSEVYDASVVGQINKFEHSNL
jgi:F-type H+-transporting ATPase subunit delta